MEWGVLSVAGMFLGNIQNPNTYDKLIRNAAILDALAWIRQMPRDQATGIFELQGKDVFVNVHGYDTLPREDCRFESHRQYLDLQYCIAGGELIDHARLGLVKPETPYEEERDLLFHHPAGEFSVLRMAPGDFALFWPEDVHRPRVSDGRNPSVQKLVVKIALNLL